MNTRTNTPNVIIGYMHCGRCLDELPSDQSPKDYARTQIGVTEEGNLQVWCNRHDCNVAVIDDLGDLLPHYCANHDGETEH